MVAHKTDVFCIVLVLTFLVYNLAYSDISNGIDISLQSKESCFALSLAREKLGNVYLKVPKLSRKCCMFILLLLCGDIESCPGPTDYLDRG